MAIQLKTIIKTNNKIEMSKFLVSIICNLKGVKLSKSELLILSHFLNEGFNKVTQEHILESKLLKNQGVLNNAVTKLRKYGLIIQDGYKEKLCKELDFQIEDVVLLKLLFDNR